MMGSLGPAPYIIAIIVAIGIVSFPVVIIFRLAIGYIKGDKVGNADLDGLNKEPEGERETH